MRFLLSRGYSRKNALSIVANRYGLSKADQMVLYRCVYDRKKAAAHSAKKVSANFLREKMLGVDWYNVYITVESGLIGETLIMGDDGFLRDIRGIHGKITKVDPNAPSLHRILTEIAALKVGETHFYLDAMISKSGELSGILNKLARQYSIRAFALTARAPDVELSKCEVVASSDSVVIEKSRKVFDLAEHILSKEEIKVISL